MKIALLSPIAWRTPPLHYGPWELIVSLLAEGLVENGIEVSLYATSNSMTSAKLESICKSPYEEDKTIDPKVWECMHIAHLFERAEEYDLIHNHYDFLPLAFSRLVKTPVLTTIHGFSSPKIIPVYQEYNKHNYYVSISNADRNPVLKYYANVYHGIDISKFDYRAQHGDYLLYFGRIHHEKGCLEAINIAKKFDRKLIIAGIIQDSDYFNNQIAPLIDNTNISYIGSIGTDLRSNLLGGAYALLHPILFAEPFGLSVVEAMACGTPVVAFNSGSMPEVVKEGFSGFLVNSIEDAVEKLKIIPELDRQNCRLWVEQNFSQERMVKDYIKIYENILS